MGQAANFCAAPSIMSFTSATRFANRASMKNPIQNILIATSSCPRPSCNSRGCDVVRRLHRHQALDRSRSAAVLSSTILSSSTALSRIRMLQ